MNFETMGVLIKEIEDHYFQLKAKVLIRPYKIISENEFIFKVHPVEGTRVQSIFSLADDVKTRLYIPIFAVFKEGPHIYIRICLSCIIHNQLLPMLDSIHPDSICPHLRIALGYDMMCNMVFDDLDKMPHLLITGASGSGKSVSIKCLLISLAYKLPVQYVNLVIFDVGGGSLLDFKDLPHLSYPIVQKLEECQYVIESIYAEMERRLTLNNEEVRVLPDIVCVIDEFVNLSEQLEKFSDTVSDILRRGRKVKIHMVLAAQSSSKGALNIEVNNITARIAFQCANYHESISAITRAGAEKLTGNGDMLYKPHNTTELEHLQGVYISDSECVKMVHEIKEARHLFDNKFVIPDANPLLSVMKDDPELGSHCDNNADQELLEIIMWVLGRNEVSAKALKENFMMGNRANTYIDKLCEFEIITEKYAKKPRKVIPASINDLSEDVLTLFYDNGITDEEINSAFEKRTEQLC